MAMINKTPVKISGEATPRADLYYKPWYLNKVNLLTGLATCLVGGWENADAARVPESYLRPAEEPLDIRTVTLSVAEFPELLSVLASDPMPDGKNAKQVLYEALHAAPELAALGLVSDE